MILLTHNTLRLGLIMGMAVCALSVPAVAQSNAPIHLSRPALVITDQPIPDHIKSTIYRKPSATPLIQTKDVLLYEQQTQTLVTRKLQELQGDLSSLQGDVAILTSALANTQGDNEIIAADYHAAVATIRTQLQNGTTPGNPRLVRLLTVAENSLEELAEHSVALNSLSMNAADAATKSNFLSESARAAFNISGAVEEDHTELTVLEDDIASTAVVIDRVLNDVNDDILRMNTYLNVERQNLRTLSLAVSNGDMYGRSLANVSYSNYQSPPTPAYYPQNPQYDASETMDQSQTGSPETRMPLAKIKFDRADVDYEQPVYAAMNDALERYPNATFDIVAVQPAQGNAAQMAIEGTRARRNADKVLRTLSQMGLDLARTNISYDQSAEATTSEVHIFVK